MRAISSNSRDSFQRQLTLVPADRLVREPDDRPLMWIGEIDQKVDKETEVALTGHPEVVARMRCHAAQRLPNLRSACGHEDLLPRDVFHRGLGTG